MTIRGTVVRGKGEGRRLGYPTANLAYDGPRIATGVYLARIVLITNYQPARQSGGLPITNYSALAIVGMWTLANGLPSIEVYLLPNSRNVPDTPELDLYGKELTIELGTRLRGLMQFTNEEDLKEQIQKDIKEGVILGSRNL